VILVDNARITNRTYRQELRFELLLDQWLHKENSDLILVNACVQNWVSIYLTAGLPRVDLVMA